MHYVGEVETYSDGDKVFDIRYVVHGAKIHCTYGSTWGRLIVPKSHGVFLRQKAQLNKMDCKAMENITPMGICHSAIVHAEPTEQVSVSFWQSVAATARSVGSIFFGGNDREIEVCESEVGSLCTPEIAPGICWLYTHEDTLIDGEEALLTSSIITCQKGGGTIGIFPDGGQDDE